MQQGMVFSKGRCLDWNRGCRTLRFPNGEYDDQVDAMRIGLMMMNLQRSMNDRACSILGDKLNI